MAETVNSSVNSKNDQKSDQSVSKEGSTSSKTSVFVVINPVAGLTDAGDAKELIKTFCKERDWECDLHETVKDEDLRKLIRDRIKQGVDMVIVSGGDGTVSAVVSGLAKSKTPLGILPAGTGNALARDLGIPLDLQAALELLGGEHKIRTMDLMEVNKEDYYLLNVSVGISSQTMRNTKRHEKRRFGMLAYVWRGLGTIMRSRQHRYNVNVDDKAYRFSATEVMIANTKLLGFQQDMNGVIIDPNDNRLDMFILRAKGFRDYLKIAIDFLLNRPAEETAHLRYLEIHKTAEIHSDGPMPAQADGEVIGNTPVDVRLVPDALRVVVPIPDKPNK